jgi:hypothetical protein
MSEQPNRPPRPSAAPSARRRRAHKSGTLRWWFWTGLVLVVAGAGWLLWQSGRIAAPVVAPDEPGDGLAPVEDVAAGDRAVVLVFPEWDAAGYVSERRRVPSRGRPEEDLLAIMRELCRGPERSGAVSALPARTEAVSAFIAPDGASAVVDFSADLVVGHPGGSAAEAATLVSILRTVALNFPDLRTCRILVDGGQAETLGGHLGLDEPFDLRRWL